MLLPVESVGGWWRTPELTVDRQDHLQGQTWCCSNSCCCCCILWYCLRALAACSVAPRVLKQQAQPFPTLARPHQVQEQQLLHIVVL